MKRWADLWLVIALAAYGCGKNAAESATPSPSAPNPAPVQAQKPEPAAPVVAGPRVDDPSFELVAKASGPYASGKLASFAIALTPHGEYHVNQEYPISISLHAGDGLSFPKSELAKADAATFGEKAARFDVPFTALKPGDLHVEAKVRFAVCTAENCVPDERTLALNLAVQ